MAPSISAMPVGHPIAGGQSKLAQFFTHDRMGRSAVHQCARSSGLYLAGQSELSHEHQAHQRVPDSNPLVLRASLPLSATVERMFTLDANTTPWHREGRVSAGHRRPSARAPSDRVNDSLTVAFCSCRGDVPGPSMRRVPCGCRTHRSGPSVAVVTSPADAPLSSTRMTWVGVVPMFSPECRCAGSQTARPAVN
jgi:hypothetical protein